MADKPPYIDDRRSEIDDRRHDFSGISQDRRTGDERRKLKYGIQFTTDGAINSVEEWLKEHCHGEWNIVLCDMDDDLVKKTIRIMFELSDDKELFKTSVGEI